MSETKEEEPQLEKTELVSSEVLKSGWIGFVPNPETLRQLEEIVPGAAERIIQMVEREQSFKDEFEKRSLEYERRSHVLGRVVALGLQVASVLLAVFVYLYSDNSNSLIFAIAVLVFPAFPALFLTTLTRRSKSEEDN